VRGVKHHCTPWDGEKALSLGRFSRSWGTKFTSPRPDGGCGVRSVKKLMEDKPIGEREVKKKETLGEMMMELGINNIS